MPMLPPATSPWSGRPQTSAARTRCRREGNHSPRDRPQVSAILPLPGSPRVPVRTTQMPTHTGLGALGSELASTVAAMRDPITMRAR
jgi:hypothetical protein